MSRPTRRDVRDGRVQGVIVLEHLANNWLVGIVITEDDPQQKLQARRSRTFDTDRQTTCILVVKGWKHLARSEVPRATVASAVEFRQVHR
jgi:hypothetical protein